MFALKAFRGANKSTLAADLKTATESNVIDVPSELIATVVAASKHEDDRREIMKHLQQCLAEPSGSKWRRVHAALLVLEKLIKEGSPELVLEAAEGRHFDVVQRASLLEQFEYTTDKRAQQLVRTKATALRALTIARMKDAESEIRESITNEKESTCSPGQLSNASASTTASSVEDASPTQISSDMPRAAAKPQGQMILNGIVAVGHSDDTTSESSGGEGAKAGVQYKPQTRKTRRYRNQQSSSSDSDSPCRPSGVAPKAASVALQSYLADPAPAVVSGDNADLLGL